MSTPSSPGRAQARRAAPSPLFERLGELYERLDAFFARTHEAMGDEMACKRGCADCCGQSFSVTALEAARIAEALAEMHPERRHELAVRSADASACPALDPDGSCAIYAVRPAICRTHGLPIRFTDSSERRSLPVVGACPKNFVGRDLSTVDPALVLDQEKVSTVLAALDAAFAKETGCGAGERIDVRALLGGCDPIAREKAVLVRSASRP